MPLIASLSVHEWAHAAAAADLGDPTAEEQGRLTLNPLVHIDPIGTVLLPLMGVPFGWARPVPVNPTRFRRDTDMRRGMVWVSIAGPLSNLALALIGGVAMSVMLATESIPPERMTLLFGFVQLNVLLAIFNMLPIPPLDGSRVADYFMPQRLLGVWGLVTTWGPLLLLVVILAPARLGFSLYGWALDLTVGLIVGLARLLGAAL